MLLKEVFSPNSKMTPCLVSPPILIFSNDAQICPPLVQLIGHVSALMGHP